jgi:preprotein translocase subunit SecG
VGFLNAAVWILVALLVAVVIELSYWWATQEKKLADQKIERIKNELKICRKEKDNE